jgi:hypothetical protein
MDSEVQYTYSPFVLGGILCKQIKSFAGKWISTVVSISALGTLKLKPFVKYVGTCDECLLWNLNVGSKNFFRQLNYENAPNIASYEVTRNTFADK